MSKIGKLIGEGPAANVVATLSRIPLQERSRVSLDRMLAAGRDLMMERGTEDFTLQEISKRSKVSIGSIYLRIDGKDNLIRAVFANVLSSLIREEEAMFARLTTGAGSLAEFVPLYVNSYADILRENAPLLRLIMQRALHDPQIAKPGTEAAHLSASIATSAMLMFSEEIGGNDKSGKAAATYHIVFATLSRELGLGALGKSVHRIEWDRLKHDLGRMCSAYLASDL